MFLISFYFRFSALRVSSQMVVDEWNACSPVHPSSCCLGSKPAAAVNSPSSEMCNCRARMWLFLLYRRVWDPPQPLWGVRSHHRAIQIWGGVCVSVCDVCGGDQGDSQDSVSGLIQLFIIVITNEKLHMCCDGFNVRTAVQPPSSHLNVNMFTFRQKAKKANLMTSC